MRLLAGARTPATAEAFARDEDMLVRQAGTLRYGQFARCVAYWDQLADPEGTDRSAEARFAARRLHCSRTFDGSWALDALLDPIGGAVVAKALASIEQSSSKPTGPRPGTGWEIGSAPAIWPARRPSAGPMPWWSWPGGPWPCRRRPHARAAVQRAGRL